MTKAEKLARAARARAYLNGDKTNEPQQQVQAPAAAAQAKHPKENAQRPSTKAAGKKAPARTAERNDEQGATDGQNLVATSALAQAIEELKTRTPLPPPHKWATKYPQHGQMVFYQGERMYVERVPASWEESVFVCISEKPVREGLDPKTGWPWARPTERYSFHVHADMIDEIPIEFNKRAARLPTMASVARVARAKSGQRDIGDDVATMLRSCNSLDDVYRVASEYLGFPSAELQAKYLSLNPGQQRMVLGNRMRAKWKKEHV